MIPLRDTERSRTKPVITKIIIAANVVIFLYQLTLGIGVEPFIYRFGLVPAYYFQQAAEGDAWRFEPVFTHMFLHGGFFHIIFNMLFLWIFGDNVEDRLGKARFVVFYLVCGLSAAYMQLYLNRGSDLPMVGASGAIAGVMGGYLVLFPRARILTLIPIFFFVQLVEIPAVVFLGIWFLIQFISGTAMLGRASTGGGTAWWAHIGGFVAGVILVRLMAPRIRKATQFPADYGGHRHGTASDATFGDGTYRL